MSEHTGLVVLIMVFGLWQYAGDGQLGQSGHRQ